MKKVIFVLVLFTTISMSMFAQERGRGRGQGQRGDGQFFAKELNLNDEQKVQSENLRKEFQTKMKEMREDQSLSKEDKMTKMKELKENHQASFNAILTPEQKEKAEKLFKDRPQGRQDRDGKHHGRSNKGDREDHPKVSDETKAQLKTLKENYEKEKKAIKMSRIAPEFQKTKLEELETKFKEDRKALIKSDKK